VEEDVLLHIVFFQALQWLELGRVAGANSSKNVISVHVTLVDLSIDSNSWVHRDSINLSEQLILVQEHVVCFIVSCLLE